MKALLYCAGIASLLLSAFPMNAQTEADLREMIESHYIAINANDGPKIESHHLPEMSIFFANGGLLMDRASFEAAKRVNADRGFSKSNLFIDKFKAQIYGNVGVATFYLRGSKKRDNAIRRGAWRVTAVWVYENGAWKEAHHHESPLVTENQSVRYDK